MNLARIYQKKKEMQKAEKSSKDALFLAEGIQNWAGAARACEMLADIYEKNGEEEEMKNYSHKMKVIKRKIGKR